MAIIVVLPYIVFVMQLVPDAQAQFLELVKVRVLLSLFLRSTDIILTFFF